MDYLINEPLEQQENQSSSTRSSDIQLPPDVEKLDAQDRAWQTGHAPPLGPPDRAILFSWRQFPNPKDNFYRELVMQEVLAAENYGPQPLDSQQSALLNSKRTFPDEIDDHYCELYKKSLLAQAKIGHELTPQESADLNSKIAFRDDDHYRELLKKDILHKDKTVHGPALAPKDAADLYGKLEFRKPEDDRYRKLIAKEVLAQIDRGPKLSEAEDKELYNKLGTWDDNDMRKLFRKRILSDFGKGPDLTLNEKELFNKWRGYPEGYIPANPHL